MNGIIGNTVGTPMPRTNYNQTDPTKADYLLGRDKLVDETKLADELLKIDKESGVYVGSGDMPDGYNVQIDPDGDAVTTEDLKGDPGYTPIKGVDYFDGTSVTVTKVTESSADGGSNVVTFSDGKTLTVKNGSKGDAYTLTSADKVEIVNTVIASLGGNPVVGVVDDNNNIVLSGALPEGTYTLKYEGTEGEYSEIVNLTITAEDKIKYTNVLPLAQEYASENPYVGADGSVGYGNNMRISTSSASATYMKAQTGVDTTGLIPVKRGDVIRLKNCNMKVAPSNTSYGTYLYGFNSTKAIASGFNAKYDTISNRLPLVIEDGEIVQITLEPLEVWTTSGIDNVAFIQLSTDGLDETSIITINQEIV